MYYVARQITLMLTKSPQVPSSCQREMEDVSTHYRSFTRL